MWLFPLSLFQQWSGNCLPAVLGASGQTGSSRPAFVDRTVCRGGIQSKSGPTTNRYRFLVGFLSLWGGRTDWIYFRFHCRVSDARRWWRAGWTCALHLKEGVIRAISGCPSTSVHCWPGCWRFLRMLPGPDRPRKVDPAAWLWNSCFPVRKPDGTDAGSFPARGRHRSWHSSVWTRGFPSCGSPIVGYWGLTAAQCFSRWSVGSPVWRAFHPLNEGFFPAGLLSG